MTCIVGVKSEGHVYLGSDSACTTGRRIDTYAMSKIIKINDMLIGLCGDIPAPMALKYNLQLDLRDESWESIDGYMHVNFINDMRDCLRKNHLIRKIEEVEYMNSLFLVGYAGRLFTIGQNFSVFETTNDFAALGSGEDYASGSLFTTSDMKDIHPAVRVQFALEAAAKFDVGVAAPFEVCYI